MSKRVQIILIIIHQTHYEKSDWSRAFNQFTIACERNKQILRSTSAWLLSPLEYSPQKQNGWTLRFCFWGWIMWKMYNKTIIGWGFCMISWIIKTSCLCYLPQPSASADNTDLGFDNSWYHAQPHPIIVYYIPVDNDNSIFIFEWRKNRLNHFLKITNGLAPKERICGVTSSTKYELLLVFCFVVIVLLGCPFVPVLVIGPPGIMYPYQSFQICQELQYRENGSSKQIKNKHSGVSSISLRCLTWITA